MESECLIYVNNLNNEAIWIDDYHLMVERRDNLIKEMNQLAEKLDIACIYNLSTTKSVLNKNSKNLLNELHEKGRTLSLINSKADSLPISPNDLKFKDIDRLIAERNYLISRSQSFEKDIKECQNQIILLNRQVGDLALPESTNQEINNLMIQRNIRIKLIGNVMQFLDELADKKVAYEMHPQRTQLKYIVENLNSEMSNFHNILNINRSSIAMIDEKIRKIDEVFLWNLAQINEETMHLISKREMFEKKIQTSLIGMNRIKNRIFFISEKVSEFKRLAEINNANVNNVISLAAKLNAMNCINGSNQPMKNQQLRNGLNRMNSLNNSGLNSNLSQNSINSSLNRSTSMNCNGYNSSSPSNEIDTNLNNNLNVNLNNFNNSNNINNQLNNNLNQLKYFVNNVNKKMANNQQNEHLNMNICNLVQMINNSNGLTNNNSTNGSRMMKYGNYSIANSPINNSNDNSFNHSPSQSIQNSNHSSCEPSIIIDSFGNEIVLTPNGVVQNNHNSENNHIAQNVICKKESDDKTDDLVLKDLDKEIEKAIHQVEDIISQAKEEISKA